MEWLFSLIQTISIFIAAIFILVLVHELGHFLAAKFFGMRVERFSIGFPPRVFGFKHGDTDYCISATPLGGYVKISGMIDESMDTSHIESEPQPYEYRSKPVWQRIIVITAGVIFNMLLAYIIFTGMIMSNGVNQIPVENVGSLYVPEGSTAAMAGFQTGDVLVGVRGRELDFISSQMLISMSDFTSSDLRFTVQRSGELVELQAPPGFLDEISRNQDFITLTNALPSGIGAVLPGGSAAAAGMKPGDEVVRIDGVEVGYWLQMVGKIQAAEGEMSFTVRRGEEFVELAITPNPATGMIGVGPVDPFEYFGFETIHFGFFGSVREGIRETNDTFMGIINGFGQLLTGALSVRENLGGPIAIASVSAEATERGGWMGFWRITAFLSITLAIMNILPIPMLDGGHLMFLIYEGITRREPSLRVKMALQQIGFVLIIGLMIFATFNDILRFVTN